MDHERVINGFSACTLAPQRENNSFTNWGGITKLANRARMEQGIPGVLSTKPLIALLIIQPVDGIFLRITCYTLFYHLCV